VLALLCAAQVLDVLGVTAVVVALPSIEDDLGLPGGGAGWVVGAYAVCFGACLLPAGRAADLYGRRRTFATGLVLFTAASLACGLAPGSAVLVASRAAQGLGAALVVPAALALLTTTFPEGPRRARALGVWTAAAAGGGAAGFALGGVLTEAVGWRAVFLVDVPVGLAALAATRALLPAAPGTAGGGLDLKGAATLTAGLVLLLAAATGAGHGGVDALDVGLLAAAVGALAAFPRLERRVATPLLPPGTLRRAALRRGVVVAAVLTATTSSAGVLATAGLQRVGGLTPGRAGLALLPFSLAVVAGSPVGARLTRTAGAGLTMAGGLAVVAAGLVLLSRLPADGGTPVVVAGVVVAGFGLGAAAVASTTAGTAALGAGEQGLAAGLLNAAAQVGTALGVAALTALAAAVAGVEPAPGELLTGYRTALVTGAALAAGAAVAVARTGRELPTPE
jgi:MFS family permease